MNTDMRSQSQKDIWRRSRKSHHSSDRATHNPAIINPNCPHKSIYSNMGFTLIEMLVVLSVSGLILGSTITMLTSYLKQSHINTTRSKMVAIDEAMQQFLRLNGRYPCVADPNAAENAATFGFETNSDCAGAGLVGGAIRVAGTGDNVLIGTVPTRTLNLTDDFMFDAWGNRLKYAISETQATVLAGNPQYTRDGGAISVVDSGGNSVITPANAAHYVLLSHGRSQRGAVQHNGVNRGDCLGIGITVDSVNCDDADATFTNTMLYSERSNASFFDDIVLEKGSSEYGRQIPAGAVMAFELVACPSGWTTFAAASGISPAGRMIIGTGGLALNYDESGANGDPYSDNPLRANRNQWNANDNFVLLQTEDNTNGPAQWKEHFVDFAGYNTQNLDTSALTAGALPDNLYIQPPAEPAGVQVDENRDPYVALTICQRN